jgi:hypothetical protein
MPLRRRKAVIEIDNGCENVTFVVMQVVQLLFLPAEQPLEVV